MSKRKPNKTVNARGAELAKVSPDPVASQSGADATPTDPPGLYVVATPIGNSRDITLRALDLLMSADVIACEDTRVTARLLAIHNISKPLIAYHDHNAEAAGRDIIKRLKSGEIVALVSDAGTPMISDPGYRLVRQCAEQGLLVTHLPGPSSVLGGLVLSGLPTDGFLFAGFPPVKAGRRGTFLTELKAVPATLVLLESPKRLAASLAHMAAVLGDRPAAVGRELTKLFEEVRRGNLADLAAHYRAAGAPKGEVTVVVGPPLIATPPTPKELDGMITEALKNASVRDAAAQVADLTGLPRRNIYGRALVLSGK